MSQRPAYTDAQISTYLQHISLPESRSTIPSKIQHPTQALQLLIQLLQHQLSTVPFENLTLHYSQHHSISIDTSNLFAKIVEDGRGGYCMENNCFFGTVLRTLGFTVYSAGARVSAAANGAEGEEYSGWSHMVNIVTLGDGKRYMVDVGFGGNGPIRPLLLDPERSQMSGIGPAQIRLVRRNIPGNSDPSQKLWIYQHRNDQEAEWVSMYCFTELEFLPKDFAIMNFWTSQSRTSWFTQQVVAVKMIMEEGEVIGTMILEGDKVKRRIRGVTEHLQTCRTEEDRAEALRKWFDIELREEEKAGIKGMITELK